MCDADVLYVIDEESFSLELCRVKISLRASLNSNINSTTCKVVCMTRMPHIKTCHKNMNILEAAALLKIMP